jgi:YesN/AraC family two-component response regulator
MLEGLGYKVNGTLIPSEALSLPILGDGRGVDLLITDVVLPGMKGTELARQLQERSPNLRVLFISGYTDEATFRDGVLAERNAFLSKPFSKNMLGGKVREVLDSPRTE